MTKLNPPIVDFLQQREKEFDQIDVERKKLLMQLAQYVRERTSASQLVQLTFLCTHNSRRSHLSQIWAHVAADYYNVEPVRTFSGGTEATAMNPRVVDSLRRTGFEIQIDGGSAENPCYLLSYSDQGATIECFSKVYHESPNPTEHYAAIMTCSSADQACPIVPGCETRLPIRYQDPKVSDGTPQERATYDERSRQICREMLYAMSRARD